MRTKSLALLLAVSVLTAMCLTGCVVDDSDRCLDDAVWSEEERACIPKPVVSDTDTTPTGDSESSVDTTPADTNPGDSDTTDGEGSGLGENCTGDDSCATYQASYCLKDPMAPNDPGICSVPNCTASDCGADFACCDCTSSALVPWPTPVCAPAGDAGTLGSVGCTCAEPVVELEVGLGESCDDDNGCATFQASYCLKDPTAPNDPGICSVPNCTPADCGGGFTCCDCTPSALVTWPTPVCAPSSDAGTLGSVGCTCEGGSK